MIYVYTANMPRQSLQPSDTIQPAQTVSKESQGDTSSLVYTKAMTIFTLQSNRV